MITKVELWAKLARDITGAIIAGHSLVHHSADVTTVMLASLEQGRAPIGSPIWSVKRFDYRHRRAHGFPPVGPGRHTIALGGSE